MRSGGAPRRDDEEREWIVRHPVAAMNRTADDTARGIAQLIGGLRDELRVSVVPADVRALRHAIAHLHSAIDALEPVMAATQGAQRVSERRTD